MARENTDLIDMGKAALMKAASGMKGPKLFNPKNGGKKLFKKKFDFGKGKRKVKAVKGYRTTVDVEADHPSEWYKRTSKRPQAR